MAEPCGTEVWKRVCALGQMPISAEDSGSGVQVHMLLMLRNVMQVLGLPGWLEVLRLVVHPAWIYDSTFSRNIWGNRSV